MKTKAASQFTLVCGDCCGIGYSLPLGSANLILADPPYNYGQSYADYSDDLGGDEYENWTRAWLASATKLLHEQGSMFIFCPDEWVSEIDIICRKSLHLHKRSQIIWAYGFGVACQKNFSRAHTHILYYTKSKTKFTFNADDVRVPSDRQLVYGDKRAAVNGKLPNNVWVLQKDCMEATLPADSDIWYQSRICGTYRERSVVSPNQIPLAIWERIIRAASSPGDLVIDLFAGTFGSGDVIAKLNSEGGVGRRYVGMDISQTCVDEATARLM